MTEKAFNLANPPIIEAVLDIDCDMPPDLEIAKLEAAVFPLLQDQYPQLRTQLRQEIETKLDAPEKTLIRGTTEAIQFLHKDERQLVQIRREGFSFNRLSPYKGFDVYEPEIERVWKIYLSVVKPRQIKAIKLRYINRIMLPSAEKNVELVEYMKIGSSLPEATELTLVGFLNQYVARDVKTGNLASVILTSQPAQADKMPFIFDITASHMGPMSVDDWSCILSQIRQLRDLKNSVFKNTLTEQCLNLFH